MSEIIFDLSKDPQKAEFIANGGLTPSEYDLVNAVVNWDRPGRYAPFLRSVHGRSLTFASPGVRPETPDDVIRGRFSGLQIIGAGGSMLPVKNGFIENTENYIVTQVDPTNHAGTLHKITQQRRIDDESGQLVMWHRAYAPLHGMDSKEAVARKNMTIYFRNSLEKYVQNGRIGPFVVPQFMAEGIFPDKLDIYGDPLHFQVYRVPLLGRFPQQFLTVNLEAQNGLRYLADFSFCAGSVMRLINERNIAYMDCHLGNMSLVRSNKNNLLFATDLGSAIDISSLNYIDRYRGFDINMFLSSLNILLEFHRPLFSKLRVPDDKMGKYLFDLYFNAVAGLVEGYFRPELQLIVDDKTPKEEIKQLVADRSRKLAIGFSESAGPQQFIEFFEKYFRTFRENSK